MPQKGNAFDKLTVNVQHKMAVREQARLVADKSAATKDILKMSLREIVDADDDFPSHRKRDVYVAIDQAMKKLGRSENPLDGLKPPPSCAPCHGHTGGTHHFLCESRKLQPTLVERRVRDAIRAKLTEFWKEWQALSDQVRPRRARTRAPAPRILPAAAQV